MLKSSMSFFIIILVNTGLFAQDIRFQWGPSKEETDKNVYPLNFIGKDDKSVFIYKLNSPAYGLKSVPDILEKYDANTLALKYSKNIDTRFRKILLLKNKLYLLNLESKKGAITIFANEISEDGAVLTSKTELMKIKNEDILYNNSFIDVKSDDYQFDNTFYVTQTADNKTAYIFPKMIRDNVLSYVIIDENFTLKEKSIPLMMGEHTIINGLNNLLIDGKNIYVLVKTPVAKEKYNNKGLYKTIVYAYSFVHIDIEKNKSYVHPLGLTNKGTITAVNTIIDDNKNIIVAGLYNSNKKYELESMGVFCLKLNSQSGEIINELNYEYDNEILLSLKENSQNEKEAIKDKVVLYNVIRNIIPKKDGGVLILSEKSFVGSDKGGFSLYIDKDILVLNLNNNLSFKNKTIIPKRQLSDWQMGGRYNSFFPIYKNEKLYIMFNDDLDNQNLSDPNKPLKTFGQRGASYMAVVQLNDDGTWTKGTLINHDESTVYLMPSIFLQNGNNEKYIYGERERRLKLVKLTY